MDKQGYKRKEAICLANKPHTYTQFNTDDCIAYCRKRTGFGREKIREVIHAYNEFLIYGILTDSKVRVTDFGVFEFYIKKGKPERPWFNPWTQEQMILPERPPKRQFRFRPYISFKDKLKEKNLIGDLAIDELDEDDLIEQNESGEIIWHED